MNIFIAFASLISSFTLQPASSVSFISETYNELNYVATEQITIPNGQNGYRIDYHIVTPGSNGGILDDDFLTIYYSSSAVDLEFNSENHYNFYFNMSMFQNGVPLMRTINREYNCLTQDLVGSYRYSFERGPTNALVNITFNLTFIDETLFNAYDDLSTSIQQGLQSSYNNGYDNGYGVGYQDGYNEAYNQDTTIATIATSIVQVGILPVNMFLAMFNYEILGINIAGLVGGCITVACMIILLRTILGNNGKSD